MPSRYLATRRYRRNSRRKDREAQRPQLLNVAYGANNYDSRASASQNGSCEDLSEHGNIKPASVRDEYRAMLEPGYRFVDAEIVTGRERHGVGYPRHTRPGP